MKIGALILLLAAFGLYVQKTQPAVWNQFMQRVQALAQQSQQAPQDSSSDSSLANSTPSGTVIGPSSPAMLAEGYPSDGSYHSSVDTGDASGYTYFHRNGPQRNESHDWRRDDSHPAFDPRHDPLSTDRHWPSESYDHHESGDLFSHGDGDLYHHTGQQSPYGEHHDPDFGHSPPGDSHSYPTGGALASRPVSQPHSSPPPPPRPAVTTAPSVSH